MWASSEEDMAQLQELLLQARHKLKSSRQAALKTLGDMQSQLEALSKRAETDQGRMQDAVHA